MELCKDENALQVMYSKPPRYLVHLLFYRIAEALLKLHSTGVIHNDIKLDNIMVE